MSDDRESIDEPTHTQELRLEPVQFIARTDAVMRLGALMLGAGTSSARVRDGMARAATAVGIDTLDTRVGMTDIVATAGKGGLYRTRVADIARPVVDASRITALKRLTNELGSTGTTAHELDARLDRIERMPRTYTDLVRIVAVGAACTAFALLNNGGWQECVAVFLAAALGQWVRMMLHKIHMNEFLTVFMSATVALLGYQLVSVVFVAAGLPGTLHDAALTSAILYLVPGFALVTGALDLGRLDLSAGIARVTYAGLVLLAAGTAVWGFAAVFGTSVSEIASPAFEEPALSGVRLVAGFVGVLGFAILFSTPLTIALVAAAIGATANVGRLLLVDIGIEPAVAAAAAALTVGLGAWAVVGTLQAARVTLTVPAVIIMIPGANSYRAIAGMIDGDTVTAIENGLQAVLVIVALAVGLTVARVLTEREWGDPVR